MSQENVKIVRCMLEGGNIHAVDAEIEPWIIEFFDPEIEWHDAPSLPGAGVYRGREELQRHVKDYLDAWTESRIELEQIRSVGDRVLAHVRYVGIGRSSGAELEDNDVTAVYDFRAGRLLRVRHFMNEADALTAMGLDG